MPDYKSPIHGHKELTPEEIELINASKEIESQVLNFITRVKLHPHNPRWLAIGQTDIQKGFMAVVRAIAQNE